MLGNKLINTNAGGGCTNTVDLYNPFPDGGGLALYQLNGNATDVSGNYNGTATSVTYGAGEFGQAGVFNGSNSTITNSLLRVSSTMSYSVWFKTTYTGRQCILMLGNGSYSDGIELYSSTEFGSYFNQGIYYINCTTASSMSDGNWHNIVITNNSTTSRLIYFDGVLLTPTTQGSTVGTRIGTGLIIGRLFQTPSYYFNGSIDQVRIFNRALRPYEIEALQTEV